MTMLTKCREEIATICKELKIPEFFATFQTQWEKPAYSQMTFEERLLSMLQAEQRCRQHKRQSRNLKNARLPQVHMARLEHVDWEASRGLNRSMLEELCECEWIKSPMKPWVVIHGATGCGKSYIASLLAYQACMHGYTVSYYNMAQLITEIDSAKANNKVSNLRNSLFNKQLLVIDDFGIEAMDDKTASDFLTILEQRMGIRSLIIVGQVPIKQWHGQFSDPIKADAVMDRVINQSYIIELSGKSMREKYGAMLKYDRRQNMQRIRRVIRAENSDLDESTRSMVANLRELCRGLTKTERVRVWGYYAKWLAKNLLMLSMPQP